MSDWPQPIEALLQEEAEDLYEHAPCGYLSLLSNGVIARVNGTFLEWTGFEKSALIGRRQFVDLLGVGVACFTKRTSGRCSICRDSCGKSPSMCGGRPAT